MGLELTLLVMHQEMCWPKKKKGEKKKVFVIPGILFIK